MSLGTSLIIISLLATNVGWAGNCDKVEDDAKYRLETAERYCEAPQETRESKLAEQLEARQTTGIAAPCAQQRDVAAAKVNHFNINAQNCASARKSCIDRMKRPVAESYCMRDADPNNAQQMAEIRRQLKMVDDVKQKCEDYAIREQEFQEMARQMATDGLKSGKCAGGNSVPGQI